MNMLGTFKEILDGPNSMNEIKEIGKNIDSSFDVDKRVDRPEKLEYMSTYEERLEYAGRTDGKWTGKVGESKCIPNNQEIKALLAKYNVDGIEYINGVPDFTPVSEAIVKIQDMETIQVKNYRKANYELLKEWNAEKKDGRTDWKRIDVENYRTENKLAWHEDNDRTTCYLVRSEINLAFKHLGGVSECKKYNGTYGGNFDE